MDTTCGSSHSLKKFKDSIQRTPRQTKGNAGGAERDGHDELMKVLESVGPVGSGRTRSLPNDEKTNTFTSIRSTVAAHIPVSPVQVVKRSSRADIKDVLDLETPMTRSMFGEVNVSQCIEKCICRSMFNDNKELVAFVAVLDHPKVAGMAQCRWQNWIRRYYRLENSSSWNTLFIHYLVWDIRYPNFFIHFLKSLYMNSVQLEQVLMVVPPGLHIFKELSQNFTIIFPKGGGTSRLSGVGLQTLYLNLRLSVVKKLIVRKAGEEDNIDVQPLLSCQYNVLKSVFGDFELGQVIDLNNKDKSTIVAEKTSGVTVGMMALTSDVNYQHIVDFFYVPLSEFHRPEMIRPDVSKLTLKHDASLATEDDLQSLKAGLLEEAEEVHSYDDDEFSMSLRGHSMSEVYLDDEDSEFRIVDPAMEYLLSKKKKRHSRGGSLYEGSIVSLGSTLSIECNTYYGRPSWALCYQTGSPHSIKRRTTIKEHFHQFTGPEKGFQISLFALHPDIDTRYAFDLLEAGFECYPDKDYCFLALPTHYQGSPLTRHFVRLTPRLSRDFPHELYFVHRNSVFSEFKVRPVSLVDYDCISELIENLSCSRKIRKDLSSMVFDECPRNFAYVLECEDCIVGIAIVYDNFHLEQTEPHYQLEEAVQLSHHDWEQHGLLRHVVVSTMFLRATSYFLRQVMHQTGLNTLSYCLLPADLMTKVDISLATVLGEMTAVRPRKRIQYDLSALDIYTPEEYVVQPDQEYALFIATERLLSVPKLELNYRVVVVGASDTALSFLEHLVFSSSKKHITYNNVSLITLHGLPWDLRQHKAGDKMLPHSGHFTREYLVRLSLQTHVNILYGIITVINRKQKMICLNDEHWLRYDYLFLFTGLQFCKPISFIMKGLETDGCHKHDDMREVHNRIARESGDNIFLVNTTADSIIALSSIRKIVTNRTVGKIVVYGNCINMYTCIESLLQFGMPGQKIVLVEDPDTCTLRGLDTNSIIEKAVVQSLQELGVTVHQGFTLVNWSLLHKTIHKVKFCTDTNLPLVIDCLALFWFGNKTTSGKTYIALSDSGIVYNDGIIINSKFRTNDEFIFAAGPGTKYSSKYQHHQADHVYFNSLEVGLQASLIFRQQVEPRPHDQEDSAQDTVDVLPLMKEPITLVAQLPGGWNYFRISAPGRPLPLECQLHGQGESGPVLTTGDTADVDGPGYFQLTLSVYNTVREIACLSKKEIPYQNFQCLYGKHERLLNNLLEHYNLGLIPDLYAFFSQPWAYAVYTTGFDRLVRQCADIFQADEDSGMSEVIKMQDAHRLQSKYFKRMSVVQQEKITQLYGSSSVPLYVDHLTLKYISERPQQLPMYLTDAISDSVRRTYTSSPMHKSRNKYGNRNSD